MSYAERDEYGEIVTMWYETRDEAIDEEVWAAITCATPTKYAEVGDTYDTEAIADEIIKYDDERGAYYRDIDNGTFSDVIEKHRVAK